MKRKAPICTKIAFNRQLTADRRLVSPTETRTFLCLPMHSPTSGNRYHMTHTLPRAISCRCNKNEKTCRALLEIVTALREGLVRQNRYELMTKNIFFVVL